MIACAPLFSDLLSELSMAAQESESKESAHMLHNQLSLDLGLNQPSDTREFHVPVCIHVWNQAPGPEVMPRACALLNTLTCSAVTFLGL